MDSALVHRTLLKIVSKFDSLTNQLMAKTNQNVLVQRQKTFCQQLLSILGDNGADDCKRCLEQLGQVDLVDREEEMKKEASSRELMRQKNLAGMQVIDRDGDRLGEVGEFISRSEMSQLSTFVLTDEAREKFINDLRMKRDAYQSIRAEIDRCPPFSDLNNQHISVLKDLSLLGQTFRTREAAMLESGQKIVHLRQCIERTQTSKLDNFVIRVYHCKENDIDENL